MKNSFDPESVVESLRSLPVLVFRCFFIGIPVLLNTQNTSPSLSPALKDLYPILRSYFRVTTLFSTIVKSSNYLVLDEEQV